MTAEDLINLRKAIGLTQAEMAEQIGLSPRAYQDIETGRSPLRKLHAHAAAMVSLEMAVANREPMIALPHVRKMALNLAHQITEGSP